MPKAPKASPAKRFQAKLERMRSRLNWIIISLPFDAAKLWGVRGQIKVKGEINGFAFQTSLFPTGNGGHILLINKRMQKGARVVEGSLADFCLELDTAKRSATIPECLKRLIGKDRFLNSWYEGLNYSTRREIAKWIMDPKSAEAQRRRAEQMAERLLSTMDAERELPPILQVAFARHPDARAGWDAMSALRRRRHLFGIFYYRNPESQTRRVERMLEDASMLAEKKRRNKK